MTRKPVKNIPASVKQKLLNLSRKDKQPFNELIQYYSMERFLYRVFSFIVRPLIVQRKPINS